MPRSKPAGWPKLMSGKVLSNGATAYYWAPPTWAKGKGCAIHSEALGADYAIAKRRCDEVLNRQFDAWRTDDPQAGASAGPAIGTFDWMVAVYKRSPRYMGKKGKTRKEYDAVLALVSGYLLKDRRCFGTLSLKNITPGVADRLHEKLKARPDGGERERTADGAMRVCRRAWNVAWREKPEVVPLVNPFAKMGLSHAAKPTRPVNQDEMLRLVAAADAAGEPSVGTAAMIAFYWLQRQTDIINNLSWTHYRPADAPDTVRIYHQKTGALVELPLVDDDGTKLWPELMARLDSAPKRGTLIVTRDKPDRRRKIFLPWNEHYFRHRFAEIRRFAGIDPNATFMGLRHGGHTEAANAGLTDAQIRALSGHRTAGMITLYAHRTMDQRKQGARIILESRRTKRGGMSE